MKEKRGPNGQKIKLQILNVIRDIIRRSHWNQMTAAKVLGVDQPKISQIISGKTAGFSLERLLIFLMRLGCEIELSISTKRPSITDAKQTVLMDHLDLINLIISSRDDF